MKKLVFLLVCLFTLQTVAYADDDLSLIHILHETAFHRRIVPILRINRQ